MPLWQVLGGGDKGGILVREGEAISSPQCPDRLATGSNVEEVELVGERLHYKLVKGCGTGPEEGWVSLKLSGRDLVRRKVEATPPSAPEPSPSLERSNYRLRLAVNIAEWQPEGEAEGPEFQFLLSLIQEEEDRTKVMKFRQWDDKKRALMSRLLIRQASMSALGHTSFKQLTIKRTKGKKPFLDSPLPHEGDAPNWNVNASHEGSWVVCASEPFCIAGIDVAELRRFNPKGSPVDFRKSFGDNLTASEWKDVDSAGEDLDDQYEVFSRFWSAKEAFVKARGDGLAYPLGKAEFHWTPLPGYADSTAYKGIVVVEGINKPQWSFVQYKMPGTKSHWTTVGRGPLTDIIDANGDFTKTLRRPQEGFTEAEWLQELEAGSPPFDVVPVGALVPAEEMEGYVKAGGAAPW